jgi:hypothetical protein
MSIVDQYAAPQQTTVLGRLSLRRFLTWVCTRKSPGQRHELASLTSSTHAHYQPRLQRGILYTFNPSHSLDTPPPLPRQSSLIQSRHPPPLPAQTPLHSKSQNPVGARHAASRADTKDNDAHFRNGVCSLIASLPTAHAPHTSTPTRVLGMCFTSYIFAASTTRLHFDAS